MRSGCDEQAFGCELVMYFPEEQPKDIFLGTECYRIEKLRFGTGKWKSETRCVAT